MKNFMKSLACLALYFIIQLIVQIVFMLFGNISGIQSENELMEFCMNHLFLMTIVANIVTILLFILFMKVRKKNTKEEWCFVSVSLKSYLYPSISAFLLSFAWALATYDLSFANADQIAKSTAYYGGNTVPGNYFKQIKE